MKQIFSMFALLLVFLLLNAGVVGAITLTVNPNPATVGQSALFTVNANITGPALPCPITVGFGDGSPDATLNCASTGPCVGVFPHTYTTEGVYPVSATGPVAAACAVVPNPLFNLTVNCPSLNISTSSLPGGIVGRPYTAQLISNGGVAPISWEVADTYFLPDGLNLSPTGFISGTPTTYGISNFRIGAEDVCDPPPPTYVTKPFSINIASPATSELTITRLQLSFDNGRPETTVNRNQPGLRANADLRFNGSGLLQGYWEVDGRVLSQVNQHMTYGKSIRLTTPAVPFLPTFVEGSHRVRLVITSPENDIPFPEAIYYVTAEESTAGLAPIRVVEPRNHAALPFGPQSFNWQGTTTSATMYLVEFFEKEGEDPVAAAYTKGTGYDLPESILNDNFSSGKAYLWWVKSYDGEGNLVGVSELTRFVFQ